LLVLWAACFAWPARADAYRWGNTLTPTGPEEMVFDWSRDQCAPEAIPDTPARAFRDSANNVHLMLAAGVTRQFVGSSLNSVRLNCDLVMGAAQNADPAEYSDREWVTSPYTLDGSTVYSLVHNEYLGRNHPGMCSAPPAEYAVCAMYAVTSAISQNGGTSFSHAGNAAHLVAAMPYRYALDVPNYGLSPGGIVKHFDGYYYALIRATDYQAQRAGACLMRTKQLADPTSWRAWDGDGFNVQFINPYTSTSSPSQHVCQPLDYIKGMTEGLSFNTWLGQYVLVGTGMMPDPALGRDVWGFYYSTSTDLIHWSEMNLIMEAVVPWTYKGCGDDDPVQYPSLLDPNSTTRNFETTGRTMYLYLVRDHYNQWCNQDFDRDLVRIPVAFPNETPPGPGYARPKGATPMRIPLVPAYKRCTAWTTAHGQPLGNGSCPPPVMRTRLTLGTPEANGKAANSTGWIKLRVVPGNSSTTADEADVKVSASLTDVRRRSDLADYTGELKAQLTLRVTDRNNNAEAPSRSAATTTDSNVSYTVPCQATSQTDRGATCAVNTTADSVLPGAVPESKRTIWSITKVQVYDGGPDNRAATGYGNQLFAVQGIFVP
jgi:hypothetical protein